MKKILLVLTSFLCAVLLTLSACSGNGNELTVAQKASSESAISLVASAEVYQSGSKVYGYSKDISLRNGEVTVTVTEWKLNGSFEGLETTSTETYELDRSALVALAFDGNIENVEKTTNENNGASETVWKGSVANGNISKMLNSEISPNGDATFTATVSDGKMQQIKLAFNVRNETLGELNVVISYVYGF